MQNTKVKNEKENVLAGAVGAFLFALAGGALWYVLYQIGFIAGISGIVAVICALKGYSVFAKAESKKGVIISVIMAALVLVIAWYLCLSFDVFEAYKGWYENGEVDYAPTFFESVSFAYVYLFDSATASSYWFNLLLGLAFCAGGAWKNISAAFKKVDNNQADDYAPVFSQEVEAVAVQDTEAQIQKEE